MNYTERIQASIDYIETNLEHQIPISQLAQMACLSISQYYFIFQTLVGDTVKEYIRKRRLSYAALELIKSNKRIIDIAIESQYESQEAFTRAFLKLYGINPGQYRKNGGKIVFYDKKNVIEKTINNEIEHKFSPQIIIESEMKIVGMEFITSVYDAMYNNSIIQFEMNSYWPRYGEIHNVMDVNSHYGIIKYHSEEMIYYFAGNRVSKYKDIPKGMMLYTIPPHKYSVLTYKGEINPILDSTMKKYAFKTFLPQSGYQWADDFVLNVFECDTDNNTSNKLSLYLPIK